MKEHPTEPSECKICGRVKETLETSPIVQKRLSNDERASLVQVVQNAILNKSEGNYMAENETYIMEKAQFNEFYSTLDTLIKATGANVDRTRGIEDVVMKMVHGFADVVAKVDELAERVDDLSMPGMPGMEEETYEEEEMEPEDFGSDSGSSSSSSGSSSSGSSSSSSSSDEDGEDEMDEEIQMPGGMEAEMQIPEDVEKAIFEAGWKAHEAEMMKANGVPQNKGNFEYPAFNEQRPGATATEFQKSFDSTPAAIPQDFNAWANTKPGDIIKMAQKAPQ